MTAFRWFGAFAIIVVAIISDIIADKFKLPVAKKFADKLDVVAQRLIKRPR